MLASGLALLGALSACSADPGAAALPPPAADLRLAPSNDPQIGLACADGQVESCALTLGEHNGVLSCYEGTRSCQSGAFGPCENGYTFTLDRSALNPSSAQLGASLRPLSLSSPTDCLNNPCNSYCREFNEFPDQGMTADPDPSAPVLSSWPQGSLGDYPAASISVGIQEPCQLARDCQFNTSCVDPAFGSCSHSVCSTGSPLAPGCNRCAETVCSINADCCGVQPECAHDPCDSGTGSPLDKDCDPCVSAVCAAHPECCTLPVGDPGVATWDDACVGYIATECAPLGQSCGCPPGSIELGDQCVSYQKRPLDFFTAAFSCVDLGTGWQLIEVDNAEQNAAAQTLLLDAGARYGWLAGLTSGGDLWNWRNGGLFFQNDASGGSLQGSYTYANWNSGEPALGVAGFGILIDANGKWSDEVLDNQYPSVCEGPRSFLTPRAATYSWGPECVDLAESTCGGECSGGVPLGLGACVERLPTELDTRCAGFDLGLGATCADSGKPMIPVCNHGQSTAPAGVRLSFLPASELGKAAPDMTLAGDCSVTEPIPPGRCVVVSDCPGLKDDSALIVNPPGGSQDASECRLDDNWSVYQPLSCGAPICETGTYGMRQVQNADCRVPLRNPLGLDTDKAVLSVQPGITQPHCAPDERLWGNSCYFYADTVDTWEGAEKRCQERGNGWTLVALNSESENNWVRGSTDLDSEVQIGLNDRVKEGDHVWSNGSCRSWSNWNAGTAAPNNSPPGSEQCARMSQRTAAWDDTDCTDLAHPFVCEGPLQDPQGGCASGELMGPDGRCYAFDSNAVKATEASDLCAKRGLGWGLVQIDSLRVNDFVTGIINCTPTWIRGVNAALPGSLLPVGDPYIDELGKWSASPGGDQMATLCQGPAVPPASRELTQVKDAASCNSGGDEFFFTGSPVAPEAVRLCPDTCTSGASVAGGHLDLAIPCAPTSTPVMETTRDKLYYSADCEGGGVVWDFFYYDAVTPADSRIEFEIRTAPTLEELTADTIAFTPIAQAHAVPTDTQRCEVGPPNCPVDIFTKLGSPAQQYKELELRVKLIPGTSGEGPLLRDWRVRYSCPPSQ